MRWFVRGDIDGFFGLALDNLVQILLIAAGVFSLGLMHGLLLTASAAVSALEQFASVGDG